MHTHAEHAVPPSMPVPVSVTVCHALRFSHRALAMRGPRRPRSSPRVLPSEVLSTGIHNNLFVTLPPGPGAKGTVAVGRSSRLASNRHLRSCMLWGYQRSCRFTPVTELIG